MHDRSSLHDYLVVVRRWKWLVVQALVVVPAVAVALSLLQAPKYEASAEVLLGRQNLAASLSNVTDQSLSGDPARLAQTQADLAQVPRVAARVLSRARIKSMTPADFLGASSVSAKSDADLLVFTVRNRDRVLATRLATLYARAYVDYRAQLDTAAIRRARKEVLSRIAELNASGGRSSALYASLADKEQQLATMEALQTSNASLVKPAQYGAQVEPRPVRNGFLGLVLGLVLGLGLAFLREALDTHVRSADSLARRLGLPILAQIPRPPRSLRSSDRLAMVERPETIYAEPYRILKNHLDLVNVDQQAKTVMVTSAIEGEGKSTTVANLAVAAARAGRQVVLVDVDFRHPYLRRFFPLRGPGGLTDVALGRIQLGEALIPLLVGEEREARPEPRRGFQDPSSNGSERAQGSLLLLPTGALPPSPGEFIGSAPVKEVFADLAARAELVLIDSAPLLGIGDALTLASIVDGLILVTRLNVLRRAMLRELERALEGCKAKPLGIVVTGANPADTYGYAYGCAYPGQAGESGRVGVLEERQP